MATRVLATDQARNAITQIQSIVNGGLQDQVNQLNTQGTTLSDPNVWDGPTAIDFRTNVWPNVSKSLTDTLSALDELRGKLDTVTKNIMAAGGGA
jgi:hypothetical protein